MNSPCCQHVLQVEMCLLGPNIGLLCGETIMCGRNRIADSSTHALSMNELGRPGYWCHHRSHIFLHLLLGLFKSPEVAYHSSTLTLAFSL